jgi:hypothetical protein
LARSKLTRGYLDSSCEAGSPSTSEFNPAKVRPMVPTDTHMAPIAPTAKYNLSVPESTPRDSAVNTTTNNLIDAATPLAARKRLMASLSSGFLSGVPEFQKRIVRKGR